MARGFDVPLDGVGIEDGETVTYDPYPTDPQGAN